MLREAGFKVEASRFGTSGMVSALKANPPAAIVVDLDRLPSHGKAVATVLRSSPSTRRIPLVFAGGAPEKVEGVRVELPDAVFASWRQTPAAIRKAIQGGPANLVKPQPVMERYSNTALSRKLGLPASAPCALVAAPDGFAEMLDDLPEEFAFQSRIGKDTKLAIWFVRSAAEMAFALERASIQLPAGASIWMVFPKRSGSLAADFTSNDVRETALGLNLVDYKICAVDKDWSGMKFARRRK